MREAESWVYIAIKVQGVSHLRASSVVDIMSASQRFGASLRGEIKCLDKGSEVKRMDISR